MRHFRTYYLITTYYPLPTTHYPLPTTHSTHYQLRTTHYTRYSLTACYFLLPTYVTRLRSSCGEAQKNMTMLLSNGYTHLYWAALNYLGGYTSAALAERDKPLLTLHIHPSIAIGQSGSMKACEMSRT